MKTNLAMHSRRTLAAAVLALAAMLGACRGLVGASDVPSQPLIQRYDASAGLVQTLRIANIQPAHGETLRIESVITNEGAAPVAVTSRTCGLDLQTTLRLDHGVRCAGYSEGGVLGPGGTRMVVEEAVITSRPGTYSVRLRHLLDPEQWVSFQITVHER